MQYGRTVLCLCCTLLLPFLLQLLSDSQVGGHVGPALLPSASLLRRWRFLLKVPSGAGWICMRVVPLERPWKEYHPLYVFDFLISLLNIWKDFKILSRFIQKWKKPPACSDYTVCIESFLPIGWRPFIWWKNPLKCCTILVWIAGC